MKLPFLRKREPEIRSSGSTNKNLAALMELINSEGICAGGYTSLDHDPTIKTACERLSELVGLVSWHLMANTEDGDIRIKNELARKIDISPSAYMTRQSFYQAIAMNLVLYGKGNAIVRPHTDNGYLRDLEVIDMNRVSFIPDPKGYGYFILIDGVKYAPEELIHFKIGTDRHYSWKGSGIQVAIKDVADNLKQAQATEKAFLSSKWKPSMIVNVDAMSEAMATKEGRDKITDDYIATSEAGKPWIIPSEQMNVQQVKPLSLQDLAINDSLTLNKKTAAAIVGVPAFLVGVGEFSQKEYNNFIQTRVRVVVEAIQQTMTKAILLSPDWYIKGNIWTLLDWDLQTITSIYTQFGDRGWVTGNEARDRINLPPKEGLDELKVLENYIPSDMSGDQKKLIQED